MSARLCVVCLRPGASMCALCCRSYDRSAHAEDSVLEAMLWAAKRARRFASRARQKRERAKKGGAK